MQSIKNKVVKVANEHILIVISLVVLLPLAFIWIAFVQGRLPDFFVGEEFLVFHYADAYNHIDAWQQFFFDHGRLFEGIYWTYAYKIFGYAPAELHLVSFLLHIFAVVLASLSFLRVWPRTSLFPVIIVLIVLLLFFNHKSLVWDFYLAGDNSRLSLILLFSCSLAVQQWFASGFRTYWLVIAGGFFLVSLFTYEIAVFLFPAALLLGWPLCKKELGELELIRKARLTILLGFLSMFSGLVPYAFYELIVAYTGSDFAHPVNAYRINGSNIVSRSAGGIAQLFSYLPHAGKAPFGDTLLENLVGILVIAVVLAGIAYFVLVAQKIWKGKFRNLLHHPRLFLLLAGLWFFFMGMLPFAIAGVEGGKPRVYYVSIIGFIVLLLFLFQEMTSLKYRISAIIIMGLVLLLGVKSFYRFSSYQLAREDFLNRHDLSLIQLIPAVKENTTFVQLDHHFQGINSCVPNKIMLYGEIDLQCAHITGVSPEVDTRFRSEVHPRGLFAKRGGWILDGNWILLGMEEDGTRYIIPEITPDDQLQIQWFDMDKLITDYNRILPWQAPSSQMYFHLLERREILDLQLEK